MDAKDWFRWFARLPTWKPSSSNNEREALALENNLIKRYQPKFNCLFAR